MSLPTPSGIGPIGLIGQMAWCDLRMSPTSPMPDAIDGSEMSPGGRAKDMSTASLLHPGMIGATIPGAIGYRLILGALLFRLPRPRVLVGHGQAAPAGRLVEAQGRARNAFWATSLLGSPLPRKPGQRALHGV
jgi:hypothetical protein